MKRLLMIILSISLLAFVACEKNEGTQVVTNYPESIDTYVAANYPTATIQEVVLDDGEEYEVLLNNNTELTFDLEGNFLEAEEADDENEVAVEDLPQAIKDYVAANYPNNAIAEAELDEDGEYEVELDNDLVLEFDSEGNFLEIDTDDDDEDEEETEVAIEDLPQAILDYIATNYPNSVIEEAEIDEDGEYTVELDNDLELEFDSEGNFLEIDDEGTAIAIEDLPQVILDYIATNYPNNTIVEAEIDGNGEYEVELDNGFELEFDANGNFLAIDMDDDGN